MEFNSGCLTIAIDSESAGNSESIVEGDSLAKRACYDRKIVEPEFPTKSFFISS